MRSVLGRPCFVSLLDKIIKGLLGLLGKGAEMVRLIQVFKINRLNVADTLKGPCGMACCVSTYEHADEMAAS